MTLPAASHVVPVLLALCVGGAMAYYDPVDFDTITDAGVEEENPYLLHHRVSHADVDVRQPGGRWEAAPDPRLYVLAESAGASDYDDNDQLQQTNPRRVRRNVPSLSIVNSLDVLRKRLLLELAQRRQRQSVLENREFMKTIGKRAAAATTHRGRKGAAGDGDVNAGHQQNVRTFSGSTYSVKRGNHQQQL